MLGTAGVQSAHGNAYPFIVLLIVGAVWWWFWGRRKAGRQQGLRASMDVRHA